MRVNTKQDIIDLITDNTDAFAQLGVSSVGLFGSFVREEATQESDVDLVLAVGDRTYDNLLALEEFARNLFGRSVDIIFESDLNEYNGRIICREVEYV